MELNEIRLIPLKCLDCGKEINCEEEDRVYFCSSCGLGFQVINNRIRRINVFYAKPERKLAKNRAYYLPMWQILTHISIEGHHSFSLDDIPRELLSNQKFGETIVDLFKQENAKKKMLFFIPAFGITNRYHLMDEPGFQFTVEPPDLKKDSPKDMVGGEYTIEDAFEIAKVMFCSIQMHSNKDVFNADIDFKFSRYRIVGVPFFEEGGLLIDGLKGFRIFKDALKNWNSIKEQLKRGG